MKTKTPYVKLLLFSIFTLTVLLFGSSISAQRQNLILESTFDGANPINGWSNYQHCCDYSITQQNSPTRSGAGSLRFLLNSNDPLVSGSVRTEITQDVDPENIDKWYGWSYYFPNYGSDVGGESIIQWHDVNGSCPPLSIQVWGKEMILMRSIACGNTQYPIGQVVSGQWIDIVLHVKWSTSNTGILELWRNGVKMVDARNVQTNTSGGSYLKLGINKWSWGPGGGTSNQTQRMFYVDEFRMGNANATYNDVAPGAVTAPGNLAPVARAGNDINLSLPTILTTLNGSASSDPDGTIASYSWSRVSGPTGFSLLTPLASITTLTSLLQGSYVFRLTVTDDKGAQSTDDVTVNVAGLLNQAPTATAGNDITLTLPTNSTTLNGSGTDPDGSIASYAWTKTGGPATFNIASPAAASTTLGNLVQGTYTFQLRVTDNNGATSTDNVTVVVNAAANQAPSANSGNDVVITLPTSTTTLTGRGTDIDGTISTYAWTRVSGPATYTIANPAAASTAINSLTTAGDYVFRLTVTDNNGATGSDMLTVTVNAAPNVAPTTNAGNDISLTLPTNSTTLSGSGTDTDGSISTYLWARVSGPSTYTLANSGSASTALTNLVAGTYVFRLTVTDNNGATASDLLNVVVNPALNVAPTATAGNDINITLPTNTTTLSGGGTDTDGSIASYAWTRVSGPTVFTLANSGSASTALTNLVAGTYVFRLTVTDNNGATASDLVNVVVNPAANVAPTATAGNDISITLPTNATTLSGGGTDTDGNIASYAWTRVSGPTTYSISNPASASTALTNLVAGDYVFRLTVTDNSGATASDMLTVTVNPAPNVAPIADAGNAINITLPIDNTNLNGSGTDADGTIASYAWTKISGPTTFTIASPASAATAITNLIEGTYMFQLRVTDNRGATATDNVTVVVNAASAPVNQLPTVNAGNDITITLPANTTTLTGTANDADGTIASYAWTFLSGPAGSALATANAASTGLSGLVQGSYVFRLSVTDNSGAIVTDNVTVTVNAAPNQSPVARAGNDIAMTLPTNTTTLNGGGSTDADGNIVTYAWAYVSGPVTYNIANPAAASTALSNLVQGTYVFSLTVIDNRGGSSTDNVSITVNAAIPPPNVAPTAIAGNDITITLPANSTTVNGSGTDTDGSIASYLWSYVSGPVTYTIATPATASSALTNLVQGVYVFRLRVTDNRGATATDNITVTVNAAIAAPNQAPVVTAGTDITITLPVNTAALKGTASDPDGTVATYAWSRISGPTTFTIANPNAANAGLSNLTQGSYVFRLTVTDNLGATKTDDITVLVNAAPPPPAHTNKKPKANAGNDKQLLLPATTARLDAVNSVDEDGRIVSYQWSSLNGPTTAVFDDRTAVAPLVSGLAMGTYDVELTVTDNEGAVSKDTLKIQVKTMDGDNVFVSLYPNPATDKLNVQYFEQVTGAVRIVIYDARRTIVREMKLNKDALAMTQEIDISKLRPGLYVLQIVKPDKRMVMRKFIKR